MQLNIRSRDFRLTDSLVARIQRRFHAALRHGTRALVAVTVRLRDVNGPGRGGVDKCCGVELRFAHGGSVVIRETDRDLLVAIDRAAGRSKRTLLDRLSRLRTRYRGRRGSRQER